LTSSHTVDGSEIRLATWDVNNPMPFFSLWESLRFSFGGKIGAKTTLGKALISTKNVA